MKLFNKIKIIALVVLILFLILQCSESNNNLDINKITLSKTVSNFIEPLELLFSSKRINTIQKYQTKLANLFKITKEIHPTLIQNQYKYVNIEEYNSLYNKINTQLKDVIIGDEYDNSRYMYLASKLISLLNDGHTGLKLAIAFCKLSCEIK